MASSSRTSRRRRCCSRWSCWPALSTVGGVIQLPAFGFIPESWQHKLGDWLHPVVEAGEARHHRHQRLRQQGAAGACWRSPCVAGRNRHRRTPSTSERVRRPIEPEILAEGWKYDAAVTAFMGGPGRKGFDAVAWFDQNDHRRRRQRRRRAHGRVRRVSPPRPDRQRPQLRRDPRRRRGAAAGLVRHGRRDALMHGSAARLPDPVDADPVPAGRRRAGVAAVEAATRVRQARRRIAVGRDGGDERVADRRVRPSRRRLPVRVASTPGSRSGGSAGTSASTGSRCSSCC